MNAASGRKGEDVILRSSSAFFVRILGSTKRKAQGFMVPIGWFLSANPPHSTRANRAPRCHMKHAASLPDHGESEGLVKNVGQPHSQGIHYPACLFSVLFRGFRKYSLINIQEPFPARQHKVSAVCNTHKINLFVNSGL